LPSRSDREVAILAAAYVEICLERLIVAHAGAGSDSARDDALSATLSDFNISQKIQLAKALAPLPDRAVRQLNTIRTLRNRAAHSWTDFALIDVDAGALQPWTMDEVAELVGTQAQDAAGGIYRDVSGAAIPDDAWFATGEDESLGAFFWIPERPSGGTSSRDGYIYTVWELIFMMIAMSIRKWNGVITVAS
jgi:hypothetical protein